MTESRFSVPLEDLERRVRVEREDTVESQSVSAEPAPDPRGQSPDREWFASGG
jgi:hypothetical protein